MDFAPKDISYVEIFPPIGIARVGDSEEYYLGSEVPGVDAAPEDGKFKDSKHRIRKQAVRFRAYAYDKGSNLLGEVLNNEEYTLTWTVHVANKKAAWFTFKGRYEGLSNELRNPKVHSWSRPDQEIDRGFPDTRKQLIIDSGPKTVTGASARSVKLEGQFLTIQEAPTLVCLGDIRTDKDGRLIVCASDGHSRYVKEPQDTELTNELDNDNWIDTMCDGTVRVSVVSKSCPEHDIKSKHKATIIAGPPKYTPGMQSPTTLFDLIENIYAKWRRHDNKESKGFDHAVDYCRHIEPLFHRTYLISWVNSDADTGHGPFSAENLPGYQRLLDPDAVSDLEALSTPPSKCQREPTGDNKTGTTINPHSKSDLHTEPTTSATSSENIQVICPIQRTGEPNDKEEENAKKRQNIFSRIRKPVNDEDAQNLEARNKEAGPGYMPYLSGNDGSEDEEEHSEKPRGNLWASLTELQYYRLSQWAAGTFDTGKPEARAKSVDEMPLAIRPAALTEAALEWSIGDPLYPGMELGWTAGLDETYNREANFRFADDVLPGDLTKELSLPWQSDFFRCQNHWWPSARPDLVVTEQQFNEELKKGEDLKALAKRLNERELWDGGLNRAADSNDEGKMHIGTTEMVRKWRQLGFIKREKYGSGKGFLPIHIESERDPQLSRDHESL